jgi:hypothetical protein
MGDYRISGDASVNPRRFHFSTIGLGAALIAMAAAGSCAASGGASNLLESPDPQIRIQAIQDAADDGRIEVIPILVDRLEDEDQAVRLFAIMALERLVETRLDFCYWDPPRLREEAVARWREWISSNGLAKAYPHDLPVSPQARLESSP